MPVDPRLNCAAAICCGPPPEAAKPGANVLAHGARASILMDLGADVPLADKMSMEMARRGIVFLSAELAAAIREIAFPLKAG